MKIFSLLRAVSRLNNTLETLGETLLAQAILDRPELRRLSLETYYTRRRIKSPLLRYVYDLRATSGRELEYSEVVVDSVMNAEQRARYREVSNL